MNKFNAAKALGAILLIASLGVFLVGGVWTGVGVVGIAVSAIFIVACQLSEAKTIHIRQPDGSTKHMSLREFMQEQNESDD